jgi:antitoxin VapB
MSINIKNKEAERLLAEIKAQTGKGASAVVVDLLRREHERLQAERQRGATEALESMRTLQENWSKLPVIDPRAPDEIWDYDDDGLPR